MATWLTSPFESTESTNLIMGTVRKDVEKFKSNPRFKYRVEVEWTYTPDTLGMPSEDDAKQMEEVEETLNTIFKKDPVAVLTGVYTGDGVRDLVFYTLSLHIFQKKFNEALAVFPILPLTFSAEEDPEWEEHANMLAIAEAAEDEE